MRDLDIISITVAALIGGVLILSLNYFQGQNQSLGGLDPGTAFVFGAIAGAGVQVGLRITGVS